MLLQLKTVFGALLEADTQYFNPKNFVFSFKDIDNSAIDVNMQKDVDEFFTILMQRLEELMKGKQEAKDMENIFGGVFANEFICKDCPHYSQREESFTAISLDVKNKRSIKESLEAYVEGEMLEGDNAFYCEKCEKKVAAHMRCCIKRLPNTLFIILKRFEFNLDTLAKYKLNDYVEFPMELDMYQYS